MFIIKKLIIAIILGLIGYEATNLFLDDGLQLPTTTPEISLLFIFIAVAFTATMIPGGSGASSTSTGSGGGSGREQGTVKWFNVRKGYGFITRDQGEDIFVHFRNLEGSGRKAVSDGQRVSFIVTEGDKGLQADKVKPL